MNSNVLFISKFVFFFLMCRLNLNINFGGLVCIIILYIVDFFKEIFITICIEFGRKKVYERISLEGLESTPVYIVLCVELLVYLFIYLFTNS